jgi:hypothetical protein
MSLPSNPRDAYYFYYLDKRSEVLLHYPNASFLQTSITLKSMWANLSTEEKAPYIKLAQDERDLCEKILIEGNSISHSFQYPVSFEEETQTHKLSD